MSKRNWVKTCGGVWLLFTITCLALYLALPWYGLLLLNRFFLPQGYHLQRLEFGYPGWSNIEVSAAELFEPSRGRVIIEEARIEYRLSSLLRGKVELIHIEHLSLTPTQLQTSDAESSASDSTQFLPEKVFQNFPVAQLAVESIELTLPSWQGQLFDASLKLHDQQVTALGQLYWPELLPAPLVISIQVNEQNQWQVTARSKRGDSADELLVNLNGGISPTGEFLVATLSNDSEVTIPMSLVDQQAAEGVLELRFPQGLDLQFPQHQLPTIWSLQGVIAGHYIHKARPSMDWKIRNPSWDQSAQHLHSEFFVTPLLSDLRLAAQGLHVEGIEAGFTGQLDATFSDSEQIARIHWLQPQTISAQKVTSEMWVAEMLQLALPPQSVTLLLPSEQLSALQATLTIEALHTKGEDITPVALEPVSTELNVQLLNRQEVMFDAALSRLPLQLNTQSFVVPPLQVHGRLDMAGREKKGEFQLNNACSSPLLYGKWQQTPDGLHRIIANVDYAFTPEHSLRRKLNYPGINLDLLGGTLRGQLQWDFSATESPRLALEGKGLNGYLPSGQFSGVQFQLSSSDLTSLPIKIRAQEFEMGVPAHDVRMDGELRQQTESGQWQLAMDEASAELLGGSALLKKQWLNFSAPSTLLVEVNKLDLKRLIETQQLEGLAAEGLISGTIPLSLDNFEPSVYGGFVKAVQDGVIQYQSPLSSEGLNPDLKLALDVLSNFNYQVLESSVEYSSDGSLILASKIEGSNPDVAGGKRVNLNLNTELDLKSAIYTLRLQSGLDQLLSEHFSQQSEDDSERFCDVLF